MSRYNLTVSSLNEQIKSLLESSFCRVLVEGELSRITFHNSGHIYFTLKDSSSTIRAVMFRGNASKLRFQLQEGMKVTLDGAITLYKPRGEYQINCFSIEPAGQGALALAFEQLKDKLAQKGYFEQSIKKTLPKFPKKIALITSSTGAVIEDMLRVANSRYRALEIDIYDVLVQGERASSAITDAIQKADKNSYDLIIVGRGGGSLEDLWAFNEEIVAEAIHKASTPIISAVGHESDWVISDMVADVRAGTPSIAMAMALPDTNELYQTLDSISTQIDGLHRQTIERKSNELTYLFTLYSQHSIEKKLALKSDEILKLKEQYQEQILFNISRLQRELNSVEERFPQTLGIVLNQKEAQLQNMRSMLEANNPKLKSKSGFAQISQNSKVMDIESLHVEDIFEIQSSEVFITAKVISKENNFK